jgi:hypothetical protein
MHSILDPREVNHARVGPRERKDPRSRAYVIQTIHALKRSLAAAVLDRQRIESDLAEIESYRHWEVLGYPSKDALLEAELGLTEPAIVGKVAAAVVMAQAHELAEHGEIGNGRSRGANSTSTLKRGSTDASYLARRLKRDHPDIFDQLAAGQYRSVREAAIAAGLITVPTGLVLLRRAWAKATTEERAAFLAEHAVQVGV